MQIRQYLTNKMKSTTKHYDSNSHYDTNQHYDTQYQLSQAHLVSQYNSNVLEINLNSTCPQKIHSISQLPLHRFTSIRTLIISNNMITSMQNLASLTNLHNTLRVINLQFNNITELSCLDQFLCLEQVYLSYNNIQQISIDLSHNSKLTILHLAFNKLNMSQLNQIVKCQNIRILSLYGNPLVEELSYQWVVKVSMKNLQILDEKNCYEMFHKHNEDIEGTVTPKQQLAILREAVSKMFEEKKNLIKKIQQLTNQKDSQNNQIKIRKKQYEQLINLLKRTHTAKIISINELNNIINQLKKQYKNNIKINKQQTFHDISVSDKEDHKYKQLPIKSSYKNYNHQSNKTNHKYSHKLQKSYQQSNSKLKKTNLILKKIKQNQQKMQQLQLQQNVIKNNIKLIQEMFPTNLYQLTISKFINNDYSNDKVSIYELSKLWSLSLNYLQQIKLLKQIIFGSQDKQIGSTIKIIKLKQYLKDKCLIQIVSQLKQTQQKERQQLNKIQKRNKQLINSLQEQKIFLSNKWKQYQLQQDLWKKQKKAKEWKHQQNEFKFQCNSLELKQHKLNLQQSIKQLKYQLSQLTDEFERKFKQLEIFQEQFEDFKQDKETIRQMRQQMSEIQNQLKDKQNNLKQLTAKLKNYQIQENTLSQRLTVLDKLLGQRSRQIKSIQQRIKNQSDHLRKIKQQQKLVLIQYQKQKQINKVMSQTNKQQQKILERGNKNIAIYQQKIKNLNQLENIKKSSIKELQIKNDELSLILSKNSYQIQQINLSLSLKSKELQTTSMKIQQNKIYLQSLRDLNQSISQMMNRQRQLKCSIIQLQVQNKTLLQKNQQLRRENIKAVF